MSAKHTPGPWVIQGFRIYGPLDSRSKHGNGRSLVGGVVDDGVDWRCTQLEVDGRGKFYEESMANAHLIAAAPELLDACRRLLKFNEELCEDVGVSKHYPSADAARAAIAKAEGRS